MSSDFSYFFSTCQRKSSVGLHDFISWPPIHGKKKAISLPLPPCLFLSLSLSLSAHSCTPFSFGFHVHTSLILLLSVLRGSSAPGLVLLPKAFGCTPKRGRRGVAFGCVEVCVNGQSFNRDTVRERVAMATQSLALRLFTRAICCRVAGVTSPRLANVSIKSAGPCLKGLRALRMALLLTGRGEAIRG